MQEHIVMMICMKHVLHKYTTSEYSGASESGFYQREASQILNL